MCIQFIILIFFLCKFNFEYKYKGQLFVFAVHFPPVKYLQYFLYLKVNSKAIFLVNILNVKYREFARILRIFQSKRNFLTRRKKALFSI